jgi:hypothetical protein
MIAVNIGEQDQVGLGQPVVIALTPRIHMNYLPAGLDDQAGVADYRNLHGTGLGIERIGRTLALGNREYGR